LKDIFAIILRAIVIFLLRPDPYQNSSIHRNMAPPFNRKVKIRGIHGHPLWTIRSLHFYKKWKKWASSFMLSIWRNFNSPNLGIMKAIKQFFIAAIIVFCINTNAARPEENASPFDLTLSDAKINEKDLSITGTITLKNKTGVAYTIPYFLFGLNNPTILLTLNGKETTYRQPLLETFIAGPTTVDPFSTIAEDFSLRLSRGDFAIVPANVNNPDVYKVRLQAEYRSVYADFRSFFTLRSNPTNLWLGELRSNTVEIDFRPGK
jgi:hypothetical protein